MPDTSRLSHDGAPSEKNDERFYSWLPYFHWGVCRPVGVMCGPSTGLSLIVKLPRMLPGLVKPYQDQSLRTREGRRGTNLTLFLPFVPFGLPSTSRTRRLKRRSR